MIDEQLEEMTYAEEDPDIGILSNAYREAVSNNGYFFDQCIRNRDERRNRWIGKTWDHRKGNPDAFPWVGASDQEVHVIGQRVDDLVALNMQAYHQSHTKALAANAMSLPRSASVGSFAKWMRESGYIPGCDVEHEKAVNHGLEKGLMITYVGWEEKTYTYKQEFSLDEIAAQVPELANMIQDPANDEAIAAMFIEQWPKLKPAKARKAVRQLREKGEAELYVSRKTLMDSHPYVRACSPDTEVFFPTYTLIPQEAPHVFWRRVYTVQQVRAKVLNEGWDADWAEEMIENYRGVGVDTIQFENTWRQGGGTGIYPQTVDNLRELILVVHAYQRLVDEDDESEGVYCTTFNPYYTGQTSDVPAMAKRELLNGYDSYPFVITRMSADSDRIYDTQALPEKLRGAQWQVKVERDSRTDRNALATNPPMTGPPGKRPSEIGPGRYLPVSRAGQYAPLDIGGTPMGSIEIEQASMKMADGIAGLDPENPLTAARKQFYVNKTLKHASDVLKMAYKRFQQYGPDQIFFNVTGTPDPITLDNIQDDDFQFTMTFDTLSTDPETMEAQAKLMGSLIPMDTTGRIDRDKYMEFLCYSINPALAQAVLLPSGENQAKLQKQITDDFAKLYGGVEIGPPPNGAQAVLQMAQMWMQQPDVAQRMQSDEAFNARVMKYIEQAQFQLQQAENAVIGRIGTEQAAFQGTNLGAA